MCCCPQPQVVVDKICVTYNTNVEDTDAQQIFEYANGKASGYVTLQNFNSSAEDASISTDDAGTEVIATASPDNSFTVYVPDIKELYIFSDTGEQIIGQVKISIHETVRP